MKKEFFSETFFLIISILITVSAAVGIMNASPDVLLILLVISAWRIYASAKDDGPIKGLKLGCGTVKAMYIVNWVVVGILASTAISVMFIPSLLYSSEPMFRFGKIIFNYDLFSDGMGNIFSLFRHGGSAAFVWMGLFILVCAVAIAAINIFFTRGLLTFVRSLHASAQEDCWNVEKAPAMVKWLFVLGIITCCGFLSIGKNSLSAFVSSCTGAAMIVCSRWIKAEILPSCESEPELPQSEWYSTEH